jgi:hypothetical protein
MDNVGTAVGIFFDCKNPLWPSLLPRRLNAQALAPARTVQKPFLRGLSVSSASRQRARPGAQMTAQMFRSAASLLVVAEQRAFGFILFNLDLHISVFQVTLVTLVRR